MGLDEPVATWVQLDETDLAFLRRLLGRFNADLQIVGTSLQVALRGDAGRGSLELQLYGQLARVRITAGNINAPTIMVAERCAAWLR